MTKTESISFSQLKRYFLTGLFIVVPAWGTLLVLYTLFDALDHLTVDLIGSLLGMKLPGTGVISFVLLVLWTGLGVTHLVGQRVHRAMENSLQRIPFVRSIYHTLKSMADVLKFRERFGHSKVVAFPFPRDGLWALGFDMGFPPGWLQIDPHSPLVMVFVPTAIHPFTGYLAFIPEKKLNRIGLRPEEAMKMEFSAGLYRPSAGWLSPATLSPSRPPTIRDDG